jgi:hypothetical protein
MPGQSAFAPAPLPKLGRMKGAGTTYYSQPGLFVYSSTAFLNLAGNKDHYWPILINSPIVVDQFAFEVSALVAGGNARVGLYVADTDWQPVGGPLADSGSISIASTGVKTYTPATAISLSAGRYVLSYCQDDATFTAALRSLSSSSVVGPVRDVFSSSPFVQYLTVARTYAAFPTPGTPWDAPVFGSTGFICPVAFRISQP